MLNSAKRRNTVNTVLIENVLSQFGTGKLDLSRIPLEVERRGAALVPPCPNMADIAADTLLVIKLGWVAAKNNPRVRKNVLECFGRLYPYISQCNPELIPKLNYDASMDSLPLEETELERMRQWGSVFTRGRMDAKAKYVRDLIPVRHSDSERASYFRGIQFHKNSKFLFFENAFAREVMAWAETSLITTANAVECLHMLSGGKRDFELEKKDKILHSLWKHYESGAFRLQCDGFAFHEDPRCLLYDTRAAIVIFKTMIGKECHVRLGAKDARKVLKGNYGHVLKWAKERVGMIVANDKSYGTDYTIVDFHVATWIVGQLTDFPLPEIPKKIKLKDEMTEFLTRCVSSTDMGLVPTLVPDTSTPCLAGCRFLEALSRNLGLELPRSTDMRKGMVAYLEKCRTNDGYCGNRGEEGDRNGHADLVHTNLGIGLNRSLDVISKGTDDYSSLRDGVAGLLKRCSVKGGYAIAPGMPPSAFGTRLALQIQQEFLEMETFLPKPDLVERFIEEELWDEAASGYRGVPVH